MEVASPLSYAPAAVAGTKRSLSSCSPGTMGRMDSGADVPSPAEMAAAFSQSASPGPGPAPAGLFSAAAAGAASASSENNSLFGIPPPSKRRRYLDASVESLSEVFSSHSPFFSGGNSNDKKRGAAAAAAAAASSLLSHQRLRNAASSPSSAAAAPTTAGGTASRSGGVPPSSPSSSPPPPSSFSAAAAARSRLLQQQSKHDELQSQIDEQAALIESLRTDRAKMEADLASARLVADRAQKENALLRRAVNIQQDKHGQVEAQLKDARASKAQAEEKARALEQMVVTLRYHLQAAQVPAGSGQMNDFMGMPPRPPDVY